MCECVVLFVFSAKKQFLCTQSTVIILSSIQWIYMCIHWTCLCVSVCVCFCVCVSVCVGEEDKRCLENS